MKKWLCRLTALLICLAMLFSVTAFAQDMDDEEEENLVPEITTVVQEYEGRTVTLKTAVLDLIEADGYQFKDMNKDGELQPYEDWRLDAETRAEDLLSRMSDKQKGAQMAHMTLVTLKESWFTDLDIGFALTYTYFGQSKETAVDKMNYVQSLCEESEYAIPAMSLR